MLKAKIITIIIERGRAGLFHATSPQMTELLVSGESVQEVRSAVPAVVEAIYGAHGKSVQVYETEPEGEDPAIPAPWVIVPNRGSATAPC
ncbi:MAG: hypothetical protein AAF689_16775 [Pseudomonadota bacterium]